ncbi:hypothetical protein HU200_060460 [Digitaria exilis]|uniref:F-box domain-containing protein n=1 Tax=Digitaria exilis TaxID=1010633 RepID=A0A835AEM3_9POAL|nr:hypothetical protein HU200_060460 [Digitaria exilis]
MDHLSSLPVEMHEEILRRLPLEDAIRTSGLANSWRYRWARCPGLKLVFGEDDSTTAAAVDAFLARYTCNVSHAQIELGDEPHTIDIDGWLRALAAKAIRYLVLRFMPSDSSLLRIMPLAPASLFSCSQLTSLVLERCNIPALPPSFNGFPSLETLQLDVVNFAENGEKTFEALIAKSPLLRSLNCQYPSISGDDDDNGGNYCEWTIRAPNLKLLSFWAWEDYGWRVYDLPQIEEACVHLTGPDLARFLPGMTRVKGLCMVITVDTILEQLPYFMYLKDLALHTLLTKSSQVLSMLCILRNAPNLENLHIMLVQEQEDTGDIEVNMGLLDAQGTVGFFSRLKSFQLYDSMGHKNEMCFIEFVMSKATILQEIEIYIHEYSSKSMEDVYDESSQYKRASPHAEIIVNRYVPLFADYFISIVSGCTNDIFIFQRRIRCTLQSLMYVYT